MKLRKLLEEINYNESVIINNGTIYKVKELLFGGTTPVKYANLECKVTSIGFNERIHAFEVFVEGWRECDEDK